MRNLAERVKVECFDGLVWCIRNNANVSFHCDKTVEITVGGTSHRRDTFAEAVLAHDPEALS